MVAFPPSFAPSFAPSFNVGALSADTVIPPDQLIPASGSATMSGTASATAGFTKYASASATITGSASCTASQNIFASGAPVMTGTASATAGIIKNASATATITGTSAATGETFTPITYTPDFVRFNSTDALYRTTNLSNIANSTKLTIAFSINHNASSGARYLTKFTSQSAINIDNNSMNVDLFDQVNSQSDIALEIYDTSVITDTVNTHHVVVSIDTANEAGSKVYIDGVEASSYIFSTFRGNANLGDCITAAPDISSFGRAFYCVGSNVNATPTYSQGVDADIADLWISQTFFVSSAVDLAKLVDTNGNPADLGADGTNPDGNAPLLFFTGDAANFPTNQGNGGAFTVNGTLTDA